MERERRRVVRGGRGGAGRMRSECEDEGGGRMPA